MTTSNDPNTVTNDDGNLDAGATDDAAQDDAGATDDAAEGQDSEATRPERQAAQYRAKLRQAEAEVTRLSALVDGHQRDTVTELAAAAGLHDGADILLGTTLSDFRDESGAIDPALVRATAEQLLAQRPHWARGYGSRGKVAGAPVERLQGGSDPDAPRTGRSWGDVLNKL